MNNKMTYKELYELAGQFGNYKFRRMIEKMIFDGIIRWSDKP